MADRPGRVKHGGVGRTAPQEGVATPTLVVAYYRVSTDRQGRSGLGLDAQREAVRAHVRQAGAKVAAEFTEVESGARRDRPELGCAIEAARAKGATPVVAKLDRLTRDVRLLLEIADGGVPLRCLDVPPLPDDPAVARMLLTILAAFAEFERRRIGQRVREAMARRKAKGLPLGSHDRRCRSSRERKHGKAMRAASVRARREATGAFRDRVEPLARGLLATGRTLARAAADAELNRRNVRTFTGRTWTLHNLEVFLSGRNGSRPR